MSEPSADPLKEKLAELMAKWRSYKGPVARTVHECADELERLAAQCVLREELSTTFQGEELPAGWTFLQGGLCKDGQLIIPLPPRKPTQEEIEYGQKLAQELEKRAALA